MRQRLTLCNFCQYFVGNECTAAKSAGQVNPYYCKQAQYEYRQWLDKQQLNQRKSNNRRY